MPISTGSAGDTTVTSAQTTDGSEEITVTATRRATKIQETPIAITAVSAEQMDSHGIDSVLDLTVIGLGRIDAAWLDRLQGRRAC